MSNITTRQLDDIKEVFALFDYCRSGTMRFDDLSIALSVLGVDISDEERLGYCALFSSKATNSQCVEDYELDKVKSISCFTLNNFIEICADAKEARSNGSMTTKEKMISDAFNSIDKGNSGVITPKSMHDVLAKAANIMATPSGSQRSRYTNKPISEELNGISEREDGNDGSNELFTMDDVPSEELLAEMFRDLGDDGFYEFTCEDFIKMFEESSSIL